MSTFRVPSEIQSWSISEVVAPKSMAKKEVAKSLQQKYDIEVAIDADGKPFAICSSDDLPSLENKSPDALKKVKAVLMNKKPRYSNSAGLTAQGYPGGDIKASVDSVRCNFGFRPAETLIPPNRTLTSLRPGTGSSSGVWCIPSTRRFLLALMLHPARHLAVRGDPKATHL